jgi:predicted DNA-binding transcriptional regulator AlpA
MRVHRIATVTPRQTTEPASATWPAVSPNEADAARYIGMSAAWLKKSRTKRCREHSDAPPFVRVGTRRVVYRRADLDAWQQARIHGSV